MVIAFQCVTQMGATQELGIVESDRSGESEDFGCLALSHTYLLLSILSFGTSKL